MTRFSVVLKTSPCPAAKHWTSCAGLCPSCHPHGTVPPSHNPAVSHSAPDASPPQGAAVKVVQQSIGMYLAVIFTLLTPFYVRCTASTHIASWFIWPHLISRHLVSRQISSHDPASHIPISLHLIAIYMIALLPSRLMPSYFMSSPSVSCLFISSLLTPFVLCCDLIAHDDPCSSAKWKCTVLTTTGLASATME